MQRTKRNLKNRPTSDLNSDAKPVVIHLINGETIDAPDHDTTDAWCLVYQEQRPGVEMKIPRESILYIDRVNDDSDAPVNGGDDGW